MTSRPIRTLITLVAVAALALGACGGDDETSTASTTTAEEGAGTSTSTSEGTSTGEVDRSEYVAALTDELVGSADVDLEVGEESAACLAEALLETVGVDRLQAEDISPEQLAAADSFAELDIEVDAAAVGDLGESFEGCVDFRQILVDTAPQGYECLAETADGSRFAEMLADEWATGTPADASALLFETADPACAKQVFFHEGVARGDISEEQASCLADTFDDEVALEMLAAFAAGEVEPPESARQELDRAFSQCGVQR